MDKGQEEAWKGLNLGPVQVVASYIIQSSRGRVRDRGAEEPGEDWEVAPGTQRLALFHPECMFFY